MSAVFAIGVFVFALLWWMQRKRIVSEDGVAAIRPGDADMQRAIAHARENFNLFVARLRDPKPGDENFAIKAGIRHGADVEHIWLTDVRVDEGASRARSPTSRPSCRTSSATAGAVATTTSVTGPISAMAACRATSRCAR